MKFEEILEKNTVYSAVDVARQKILYDLVKRTQTIPHAMAEVGVYRGGSSFTIAHSDPSKKLYACDSFEGLPEPTEQIDLHKAGDFNDVSYEAVKSFLNLPNIQIIKGFFPDPRIHSRMYHEKFSFVHIDVDLYEPTIQCLEFFYGKMAQGGIIVSDDYKHHTCPGVERAFQEFMWDKPETLIDTGALSCYFIKL